MDHVPTLCAISTVGIAATGFALGRPDHAPDSRPASNKRKAPGSSDTSHWQSSPIVGDKSFTRHPSTPSSEPTPQHNLENNVSKAVDGHQPTAFVGQTLFESSLEDIHTPLRDRNRFTAKVGSAIGPESEYLSSDNKTPHTGRSSSSWLRRISTISSLNDSPSSSSRPGTPSVSFSNHSNSPILPRINGTPTVLPPNKLVKRTSSHRALSASYAQPGFGPGPTFRRPATSHQRSANLLQLALDESLEYPEPRLPTVDTINIPQESVSRIWRPYFASGYPRSSSTQPRKRHTAGTVRSRPIKTVTKHPDHYPTLLVATAVMPRPSEDDLDDLEDRPFSSSSAQNDEQIYGVMASQPGQQPSNDFGEGRRKARLSFSLGDVFSTNSSPAWKLSRSESLKKKRPTISTADARNFSSPLPPTSSGSKREKITSKLQRRRNITDPSLFRPTRAAPQLDLTTSKGIITVDENSSISSPLPPLGRLSAFDIDLPYGSPTYPANPQRENRRPSQNNSLPSSSHVVSPHTSRSRPKRVSLANSDPASTLMSSEGDRVFTSGDEDSMEFQSDTAYDSLATRATVSSSSGIRAKPIERIFDESSQPGNKNEKLVPLETLIQGGSFSEVASKKSSDVSMRDAREEASTPVKQSTRDEAEYFSTPVQQERPHVRDKNFSSSPPSVAETQVRVERSPNSQIPGTVPDDRDEKWEWDVPLNDHPASPQLPQHDHQLLSTPEDPKRLSSVSQVSEQSSATQDTRRRSLFDWTEQQKAAGEHAQGPGSRPKTVHGKQGLDGRGGRPPGRRGPSALHLRSQSVPVNKEPSTESDSAYPVAKYSTWGLGHKGVSEEWTDDFEFDDLREAKPGSPGEAPNSSGSPTGLDVPQAIIDRQASVHGQFGHVKELTLLVEELKRLRVSASMLGIVDGPSRSLWEEADGIINLATLDDDENELLPPRSPSSPSFGYDPFEEDSPPTNRGKTPLLDESPVHRNSNSMARRSISSPATPPIGRARGESSAQAKSVLQTIIQNRGPFETPIKEHEAQVPKKLPFDTQDLRILVIRAGVVARALKAIVRKAEGVTYSPDRPYRYDDENRNPRHDDEADDSPLRKIFSPPQSPSKKSGLPKSRSANSYLSGSPGGGAEGELAGHLKLMTVV